jgi:predicted TIM-barrel fold metal-dependent hydrolase
MKATALSIALLAPCVFSYAAAPVVAKVDHHQHLVSPAFAPIAKLPERNGAALLRELDSAGIERAIVLSVAYSFADERKALVDPDRLTREENDWTSAEVDRSGGRLIGFCSANPLRPAALAELERCLALPGMRGIKQHFGNGGVSLRNAEHLARMEAVFRLGQRMRVPLLVHMRARGGENYGAPDAKIFLERLAPLAPDVKIVVAHLGSAGPGYAQADEIMAVFGAAARTRDRRMNTLYFDVATNVTAETTATEAALIVKRIRDVGADRILYGSDLNPPGGSIAKGWEIFRTKLPLTDAELRTIATNDVLK